MSYSDVKMALHLRPQPSSLVDDGDGDAGVAGTLYQCLLDPAGWPAALARVCAAVGGTGGRLVADYPGQVRSPYVITAGTPDMLREPAAVADAAKLQAGAACTSRDARLVVAVLAKDGGCLSYLAVTFAAPATGEHQRRIAVFVPHLDRVLRLADLLDYRLVQYQELAAIGEVVRTGMILVDAELGIRGVTTPADDLMGGRESLSRGGRLQLRVASKGSGLALTAAIADCAAGRMSRGGATTAFEDNSGTIDLIVNVLPMPASWPQVRHPPVALLLFSDPVAPPRNPLDAFAELFGLTLSETRVALALFDGHSPGSIAAAHGIGLATVRTHLRQLFDKTGTGGQAGIVKLMTAVTRVV